jgi:hypothetical protein
MNSNLAIVSNQYFSDYNLVLKRLSNKSLNVSKNNNSDSFVSFIIPSFDIQIPSVLLTSSSSSESSILSIFTPFRLLVQVPNNFPSQITSLDLIIRSVFGF